MRRERDRELERRLAELPMPGEAEAEERSWEVVRRAYADRTPVRPTYRARRFALAAAAGAVLLAVGLSPAGAKVGDWVRDVVGEEDAKPELKTLPAAGEILVESDDGAWIVRDDGSKRRLGDYDEATWSPRGLFVAVTEGHRLTAVDPVGAVRWESPPQERGISDPRWSEYPGYRVAYRAGSDLRVIYGDGTSDRLLADDVAPVAAAWRPAPPENLKVPGVLPGLHVLAYVRRDNTIQIVDTDSGDVVSGGFEPGPLEPIRELEWSADGTQLLAVTEKALYVDGAPDSPSFVAPLGSRAAIDSASFSPDGKRIAVVRRVGDRGELALVEQTKGGVAKPPVLLSGPGRLTDPTWSPDGRWLLVGWPRADQWLFVRTDRRAQGPVPFGQITAQFESGDEESGGFPRISGWVLPERPAP
jgi:hypothetical protein